MIDPKALESDGLIYGEDFGTCDICNGAAIWANLTTDWNGETGNHLSCEADNSARPVTSLESGNTGMGNQ